MATSKTTTGCGVAWRLEAPPTRLSTQGLIETVYQWKNAAPSITNEETRLGRCCLRVKWLWDELLSP